MLKTVGDLKKALNPLDERSEVVALLRKDKDMKMGGPGGYIHSVNEWEEGIVILVEPYEGKKDRKRKVQLDVELEFLQDTDIRTPEEPAMREAVARFVRDKLAGADDLTRTPRVEGIGVISVVSATPKGESDG